MTIIISLQRKLYVAHFYIEYGEDKSYSIEEIQYAVEEYAKFKNLTNPKRIIYT